MEATYFGRIKHSVALVLFFGCVFFAFIGSLIFTCFGSKDTSEKIIIFVYGFLKGMGYSYLLNIIGRG